MNKLIKIIFLSAASVIILVSLIIGIIIGINAYEKYYPVISIEVQDKIYDGNDINVNILVSSQTTYDIYYKLKNMDDATYTTTAPFVVGEYTIKVEGFKNDKKITKYKDFSIKPKEIKIDDSIFQDKIYDGTKNVNIDGEIKLIGVIEGDDVFLNTNNLQMSFEDSNAGKDKNIIINGLQVEWEDAFNYSFKTPNVTASIYKKEVTLIGFDICDKIYDGLTLANIEGLPKLDGMLENETSLSYIGNLSAKFENSEIGENKKIYFDGLTLTGENACNYQLVYPEITANILPQPTYIIEYDVNNVDMGLVVL